MKYIFLLFFLLFISCDADNHSSKHKPSSKIKLAYQVNFEDQSEGFYSINWLDTLGANQGYQQNNQSRPEEIWCYIMNLHKDTLAYYQGSSTAQNYLFFRSLDSLVYVHFKIGLNLNSDNLDFDSLKLMNRLVNPISFNPIQVNLKSRIGEKTEVVLNEVK